MPDQRAYSSDAFNRLPFREQLDALYGISARDRRDLILSAPNAQRLVQSFAAESLFHTLKEIGLEDGAELLSLASGEQVCALVDLDCWKKDRLETAMLLNWLEVIVEAGGRAVGELLNSIDRDLLVLLLRRFVRIHRRDDPEEPEEDAEGPEVFELDEHYQIFFHRRDARTPLVRSLIEALYERDYSYFVTVMEETWWGVDSDLEEAAFRLRNARLQDRGFPDYFEAQQIYRPLPAGELAERSEPLGRFAADDSEALPQDRALILPEDGASFFSQVLHAGFSGEAASELRHELAYLVNRVLVAEGVDFADRDRVAENIRVAHDTVNLALESLSRSDTTEAIRLLRRHYVQHLFRVAWDILLGLRKSAKRVVEALDIDSPAGEIAFLDTPYREGLAGILGMKPRFYEGIVQPGEIRYRPFVSLADLDRARTLLSDVAALAEVCPQLLGQSPSQLTALRPSDADDFRISAVLLTGFAHFALGRVPSIEPLGDDDLAELRRATLDPQTGRLRAAVRERFYETHRVTHGYLDFSLRRFEEEFLAVAPDRPIDPRFVTCLMIRPRRGGLPSQASPRVS
jgi:Family of unknown function (DUF6178)